MPARTSSNKTYQNSLLTFSAQKKKIQHSHKFCFNAESDLNFPCALILSVTLQCSITTSAILPLSIKVFTVSRLHVQLLPKLA
jgi:hypothetical protein